MNRLDTDNIVVDSDEPQTPLSPTAPSKIAILVILNQTAHRLQNLAPGPDIRGNGVPVPSLSGDIESGAAERYTIYIKDPLLPLGYINGQMGFLIIKPGMRLPDCPTVGLQWTCDKEGDQETLGEVDEDGFEADVARRFDGDGITEWVFTVRETDI